jgi:hypothetical protein
MAKDERTSSTASWMAILAGASGNMAAAFDLSMAATTMRVKQLRWKAGTGTLDPQREKAMAAAVRFDAARTDALFTGMARAAAAPVADPEVMAIGGRVLDGAGGVADRTVSALDRGGKAMACTTSEAGGLFRIRLEAGEEIVLMVADAKGQPLLVDDRVLPFARGTSHFVELQLGRTDHACPDGPDLSGRLTMPKLVDLPLEEAAAIVKKLRLDIVEVKLVARSGAEGIVLASEPEEGRLIDEKSGVRLTVGTDVAADFDRETVAAVLRAEANNGMSDAMVERLFAGLSAAQETGYDRLSAVVRRADEGFAQATGLSAREAPRAKRALADVMGQIDALRRKKD